MYTKAWGSVMTTPSHFSSLPSPPLTIASRVTVLFSLSLLTFPPILTELIQWSIIGELWEDHSNNTNSYFPRRNWGLWKTSHTHGIFHRSLPAASQANSEQSAFIETERQERLVVFQQGTVAVVLGTFAWQQSRTVWVCFQGRKLGL